MSETTTNPITAHLRDGEKVLWEGRPEGAGTEAGTHTRKPNPALRLLPIAIFAVVAWVIYREMGPQLGSMFSNGQVSGQMVLPLVALVVIMFGFPMVAKAFKFDSRSRLQRVFDSMGFAITDQRIMIVEGDHVMSLGPAQLGRLRVEDHGDGIGDLILLKRRIQTGSTSNRSRNAVQRERTSAGFKRVRNPEALKARVEAWADERVAELERQAAAFNRGDATAMRSVENVSLGLRCLAPADWKIEVRKKKKPFGETFLDHDNWSALGGSDDWNVIRMTGPLRALVEFEVFETEPKATMDSMTGKVVNMLLGKPTATDEDVAYGALKGFSVSRRADRVLDPVTNESADMARMPVLTRSLVLHDGRRQLYAVTSWAEECPETGKAVETVLQSIELA